MRVLVGFLLLSAVLAVNPEVQRATNEFLRITEEVGKGFQTQDYTQLQSMCAAGGVGQYMNLVIAQISQALPQLAALFAQILPGMVQCLDPMCAVVSSQCWTELSSSLPNDNCVPTALLAEVNALQNACQNGCFSQLDAQVLQSAQCLAHWAETQATNLAGIGGTFTFSVNLNPAAASTNLLCMQNPGDSLMCVTKLASAATLLANSADISDPANCPYFASLGCCATSLELLLGVFNGTIGTGCGANVPPFTPTQYQQALVACGLNNVASCPVIGAAVKLGVVQWVIDHIDFTKFSLLSSQDALDFLAALRADFAASTGLAADVVSVGKIIQAATGINVKFIIRAISDVLTQSNYQAYLDYINGQAPQFTATSAFAAGQSGLSTGTIQYNSAASSSSVETQSGAGTSGSFSVVVSVTTLFAVIAMAFAFLA